MYPCYLYCFRFQSRWRGQTRSHARSVESRAKLLEEMSPIGESDGIGEAREEGRCHKGGTQHEHGKRSTVVSTEEETRMTTTGNTPAQSYSRIGCLRCLAWLVCLRQTPRLTARLVLITLAVHATLHKRCGRAQNPSHC